MRTPIDLLIIGAGVQGTLLLRRLVQDYSVVVVGTSLRTSETLHSHGYFASGWNASSASSAHIYRKAASWWRDFLERHQINPHENAVYRAMPVRTLERLSALCNEAGIPVRAANLPEPFDLSAWPTFRTVRFPDDLVFNAAAAVHELSHPFARHVVDGRPIRARIVDDNITEVTVSTADGEIVFEPSMVCAAAGAGNAGILDLLSLPADVVTKSQVSRPRYMVCAKGDSLPNVSLFANELTLIAHPLDGGQVIWLMTYDPPRPQFVQGVLDMSVDPVVQSSIVSATLDRVKALMPDFAERAARCAWQVYAGWKTDAPGDDIAAILRISLSKPYDARTFGLRNFFAVWPNHWGLATPASQEVATVIRESLVQRHDMPDLPYRPDTDRDARRMKWLREDCNWQTWPEFRAAHGWLG